MIALRPDVMKTTSEIISRSDGPDAAYHSDPEFFSTSSQLPGTTFFRDLSESDLYEMNALRRAKSFSKRSTIFMQGSPATGIHVVRRGKIKLTACAADGRTMILGIAGPGTVLCLSAVLGVTDHETSAVVLEDSETDFFCSSDFLRLLRRSPTACLSAARHLASDYQTAYRQICYLGLSDSVFDKIGKLLLGWAEKHGDGNRARITNFFTHEEIAGMIGSSRETVTRALKAFRERGLLNIKGHEVEIDSIDRLRNSVRGAPR